MLMTLASLACVAAVVGGDRGWFSANGGSNQPAVGAVGGQRPTSTPEPRTSATPQPAATRKISPSPSSGSTGTHIASGYRFPLSGCQVSYSASHHDYPATDIFAPRGCVYVSPVAGRVDEVSRENRWSSETNNGRDRGGLFVSVRGGDGVRYYGAHLEAVLPSVHRGIMVAPGTPLGRVGDSGSAAGTGTHLHFGLSWPTAAGYWWIRRGTVSPSPYLDAWRTGHQLSPVPAVEAARRAYGDDSSCHVYC
jgi:murein DD-endopeptidase MepM/ murein hydrolase activator NlpD